MDFRRFMVWSLIKKVAMTGCDRYSYVVEELDGMGN